MKTIIPDTNFICGLRMPDGCGTDCRRVPPAAAGLWLEAAGFENQDALLPWPKNSTAAIGYSRSISAIPKPSFFPSARCCATTGRFPGQRVYAGLHFNRPLPADIKLRRDSLRCTVRQPLTCLRIMRNPSGLMADSGIPAARQPPASRRL